MIRREPARQFLSAKSELRRTSRVARHAAPRGFAPSLFMHHAARRSWLHGDGRGFRSRRHRIRSSGDYKNPPPEGEHAGLKRYHEERANGEAIEIPPGLRGELGRAVVEKILAGGHRVLVLAVTPKHLHVLVELPWNLAAAKRIVGTWKTARTPAVRAELPGSIWGEGGSYKPVKTDGHRRNAFKYIRDDQGPGAWVWVNEDAAP